MTNKDEQKKLLRARGICVVIPTYNNAGSIENVVRQTLEECTDVIVVNDGSTDKTASILRGIEGITLVDYPDNRGKGHALRCGFRKALSLGFAYAITLDGDGQHYPDDIALFLAANQQYPGALIVGERNLQGVDRSAGSSFANRFSNFWFYIQTGRFLRDTQTGYRLYPLKKLHGLSLLTSRYEAELELLVFSSWHGVSLKSIPIRVYYPPREERVSHFQPARDFLRISILNTVLCFLAVVYGLPLRLWRACCTFGRTAYSLLLFLFLSMLVITPAVWIYTKVGQFTERKRFNLHRIINAFARGVVLHHGVPGTTFRQELPENLTWEKPYLVICNHQSHLDLMCQLSLTPRMVFLTKDWVWNNPCYGYLIRKAEFYPVSEGIDELLPKLRSLVERGYSIAVYPEGTRSVDCQIGRFHQGAFYLAEQLGLDLLPMYLYGAGKALPKKAFSLRRWPMVLRVGEPIPQSTMQQMGSLKDQAKAMRKHYIKVYSEMCNLIEQDV